MLDLFSIFSKGGIVLWCFQSTSDIFSPSVNALIRNVILQVSPLPHRNLVRVLIVLRRDYILVLISYLQMFSYI